MHRGEREKKRARREKNGSLSTPLFILLMRSSKAAGGDTPSVVVSATSWMNFNSTETRVQHWRQTDPLFFVFFLLGPQQHSVWSLSTFPYLLDFKKKRRAHLEEPNHLLRRRFSHKRNDNCRDDNASSDCFARLLSRAKREEKKGGEKKRRRRRCNPTRPQVTLLDDVIGPY